MARAPKAQSTDALPVAKDDAAQQPVEQEAATATAAEPMSEETIQMEAALDKFPGELAKTFGEAMIGELRDRIACHDHQMAGNIELLKLKVDELKRFLNSAPALPPALDDHISRLKSMLE